MDTKRSYLRLFKCHNQGQSWWLANHKQSVLVVGALRTLQIWKSSISEPFAHYFRHVFHPKHTIQATLLVPVNLLLGLFTFQSKNRAALPMKQVGTMLDNHLQCVTKFELSNTTQLMTLLGISSPLWKVTPLRSMHWQLLNVGWSKGQWKRCNEKAVSHI